MTILVITQSDAVFEKIEALCGPDIARMHVGGIDEARASLGAVQPELILTDLRLPDGDAFDILEDAVHHRAPLAILHANAKDDAEVNQAIHAGALDTIDINTLSPSGWTHLLARAASSRKLLQRAQESAIAMREKEEFNFALFQHHPAAMVVVDNGGRVVKSNLAMRDLSKKLPALGKPLYDPTTDAFSAEMADELQKCIHSATGRTFLERETEGRILTITIAHVPTGAVVIVDDVSERIQTKRESERRQEQLIHADKMIALGTLVSGVAHEISNPNNVMILSAGSLNDAMKEIIGLLDAYNEIEGELYIGAQPYSDLRDELPELCGSVLRAAKKIRSLVGDLKTFARPDANTLDEAVDLSAVAKASISLVGSLIKKSTQHFESDLCPSLPTIPGNAQRLEQVMINLITNACQALPNRDAKIKVVTRLDTNTNSVIAEVIDTGEGIPPDSLKRIQDPFFTTKHDTGGTGLGLSISSKIMDSHGGTLSFESTLGHGTIASMTIPNNPDARRKGSDE
jgi:signal transduction histidine kinase